jgi:signal transduction histidine kinase
MKQYILLVAVLLIVISLLYFFIKRSITKTKIAYKIVDRYKTLIADEWDLEKLKEIHKNLMEETLITEGKYKNVIKVSSPIEIKALFLKLNTKIHTIEKIKSYDKKY